jgi:hypothetical protein
MIEHAYRELVHKGVPPAAGIAGKPIRHAVLVPKCARRVRRRDLPFLVIDADMVLGALRQGSGAGARHPPPWRRQVDSTVTLCDFGRGAAGILGALP